MTVCYNCGMDRFEGMVHHGVPYGPCEWYVTEPTRPLTDAELLTGKHSMSLTCPNYSEKVKADKLAEDLEAMPEQKELKEAGKKFAEAQAKVANWVFSLNSGKPTGSGVIAGPTGTGKTTILKNVLRDVVMAGKKPNWILFPSFLKDLKATYDKNYQGPSESHIMLDLFDCDLLVIDDLGAERLSGKENEWVIDILFSILNEAIESGRFAIAISTNLTSEDIKARYGDRNYSRLIQLATEHPHGFMINLVGTPDFRKKGFR